MRDRTIAVLFGGPSSEHDISIASAHHVCRALLDAGERVVPVLWRPEGDWILGACLQARHDVATSECVDTAFQGLRTSHPLPVAQAVGVLAHACDVVFSCVHGRLGEDGAVQGLCEVLGLPVVGSGVRASALCMDKALTKSLLDESSLITPASVTVARSDWRLDSSNVLNHASELTFPRLVKPLDTGSSVGMTLVQGADEVPAALDRAFALPDASAVLLEEFVVGDEVTCAVLGNPETGLEALPPILIRPPQGRLFDYDAKYSEQGAEELCPAPLDHAILEAVRQQSLEAYSRLGCRGLARVDFIVRADGQPVFLELNTLPGLTDRSLVPKAAAVHGLTMPDLVSRLVDLAVATDDVPMERARAVGGGR